LSQRLIASSLDLTAGTSKVSPSEQKELILIWPKKEEAGAACIAYSAKNKKKDTSRMEVNSKNHR